MSQIQDISFQPFACCIWDYCKNSQTLTIFLVNEEQDVKIEGEDTEDIYNFLKSCNGLNTISEISNELQIDLQKCILICDFLLQEKAIYDSRQLYKWFLTCSQNPNYFSRSITRQDAIDIPLEKNTEYNQNPEYSTNSSFESILTNIFLKRKSCRNFDNKKLLSKESIMFLLKGMLRVEDVWTLPSAGGMYSFVPIVIFPREVEDIKKGVYAYNPQTYSLYKWRDEDYFQSIGWYERLLDSKHFVACATMIVLLTSNISKIDKKYSNRALRFALIEAGHIAQNAILLSTEKEIGCLEYGGFDDLVAEMIVDYKKLTTLTCLIFGVPEDTSKIDIKENSLYQLEHKYPHLHSSLIRTKRSLEEYTSYSLGYVSREHSQYTGFGSGTTSEEASLKSIVESIEREVSMGLWFDKQCSIKDLDYPNFNQNEIWGYHKKVFSLTSLKRLNETDITDWVLMKNIKGDDLKYALSDMIFYGHNPKYGFSNSNGIAGDINLDRAFKSALLELIERDSFLVIYHTKRVVSQIDFKMLPKWLQLQITSLKKIGYKTTVLDITLDSIPVYLICIHSTEKHPCFVCGASAGFEYESILLKAFSEAESMLLSWQDNCEEPLHEPDVNTPHKHASLYMNPIYLKNISWILNAPVTDTISTNKFCLEDLIEKYNPYIVDLSSKNKSSFIKVVKVLSSELLPMYFGFGLEPINHSRINKLGLKWINKYPSFPHFFS